jgi:YbbR domain-containing protein
VVLTIVQEEATATLFVGLRQIGTPCDCLYSIPSAAVTVSFAGSATALQEMDPASLQATFDVTGLAPGSHSLAITVNAPDGLEVVSVSPPRLTVGVQPASPAASP